MWAAFEAWNVWILAASVGLVSWNLLPGSAFEQKCDRFLRKAAITAQLYHFSPICPQSTDKGL
jgi:hypothetical protein